MASPIKSHLPLISTRIEFKYDSLPAPPHVSARRDFTAILRKHFRQMSAPYSRNRDSSPMRSVRFRERSDSPVPISIVKGSYGGPSIHPAQDIPAIVPNVVRSPDRSDSPLTDISDDFSEAGDRNEGHPAIVKPGGEPGRKNSGGYSLQDALGWDEKRFKAFIDLVNNKIQAKLDPTLCFSKQDATAIAEVMLSTAKEFKIDGLYEKNWPVRDAFKQHLKYSSEYAKKKKERRVTTGIRKHCERCDMETEAHLIVISDSGSSVCAYSSFFFIVCLQVRLRNHPFYHTKTNQLSAMSTSGEATIDFTNGRAFVQEGVLYYSPNSKRSIIVRESPTSDPFASKKRVLLDADMFTQPCWWTVSWGWMSFIPLAPSFTSTPFEPFCWMPRISETRLLVKGVDGTEKWEIRFKMSDEDIYKWKVREQQIIEAANKIRLIHGITHGISANFPPSPSDFHYDCPHRSFRVARRMITLARDWFAIWMGLLGFLIAQASKLPMKNCPTPPPGFPVELPPWYWLFNTTMGYSPSWLDGLLSSSVVDSECARAGVIYRLSDRDHNHPLPSFFLNHKVPIWFPWTSNEEYNVNQNPSLRPFAPPSFLLQEAMTFIFRAPDFAFSELIAKYFCKPSDDAFATTMDVLSRRDVASFVRDYVNRQINSSQRRAPVPKARIIELTSQLIEERQHAAEVAVSLPQQSMLEGVDADERGIVRMHPTDYVLAREQRQREVIESQQDIQRRQSREKNPPTKNTTMYEWIKHALPGGQDVYVRVRVSKASQSNAYTMYSKRQRIYNAMANEWDFSEEFGRAATTHVSRDDARKSNVVDDDSDDGDNGDDDDYFYNNEDYDRRITYRTPEVSDSQATSTGHEEPLPQSIIEYSPSRIPWSCDVLETMAWVYGYVPVLNAHGTQPLNATNWQDLLTAVGFASESSTLTVDDANRSSLWKFFSTMTTKRRPSSDVYDLEENNRAALKYIVDFKEIQRPAQDLFIFSKPASAVCDWVLGIYNPSAAFSLNATIVKPYTPSTFQDLKHPFDVSDFEEAMLQCFFGPDAGGDKRFCDDELTEHEIAIICGTYTMYTGAVVGQTTVRSWLPPPSAWCKNGAGFRWLEWTERSESFFVGLLQDIKNGKKQPLTVSGWRSQLRGLKTTRDLLDFSNEEAQIVRHPGRHPDARLTWRDIFFSLQNFKFL
ncbi:hypothetical protein BJ912DRAFT_929879 [Pholiota molesta]|nr:hypothetical protein BJ912DRAFT_929879 [Pholiota molesta]